MHLHYNFNTLNITGLKEVNNEQYIQGQKLQLINKLPFKSDRTGLSLCLFDCFMGNVSRDGFTVISWEELMMYSHKFMVMQYRNPEKGRGVLNMQISRLILKTYMTGKVDKQYYPVFFFATGIGLIGELQRKLQIFHLHISRCAEYKMHLQEMTVEYRVMFNR